MVTGQAVRKGLRFFLIGKLSSGLLGLLWLALLARTLTGTQLGVYYGIVSLFEVTQMISSFGVYSYGQRYVPAAWVSQGRAVFSRIVVVLMAWRVGTLLLGCTALGLVWDTAADLLGWVVEGPVRDVVLVFVLAEGCARYLDSLLESTISQGVSQLLSLCRNVLRIGILMIAAAQGVTIHAGWIIGMEACLAALYIIAASVWLGVLVARRPKSGEATSQPWLIADPDKLRFALHGYLALALGQVVGPDTVRLILSSLAGPSVLAIFAFAQSLVDMVRRYMPAALLLGFVRTVLTARTASARGVDESLTYIQLLVRVNGMFLMLVGAWLLVFGGAAIQLIGGHADFAGATGYLVALVLLLSIQSVRLMAALVAHVRENNGVILAATAGSGVAPFIALTLIPVIGGAGAVLALWAQELAYVGVLLRGLRLSLHTILGGQRLWWCGLAATLAALSIAFVAQRILPSGIAVVMASGLYLGVFAAVLAMLRPFGGGEWAALKRVAVRGGK